MGKISEETKAGSSGEIIIRFKQVDNNSLPKEAKVGIVRIDEVGVGLAFRK